MLAISNLVMKASKLTASCSGVPKSDGPAFGATTSSFTTGGDGCTGDGAMLPKDGVGAGATLLGAGVTDDIGAAGGG